MLLCRQKVIAFDWTYKPFKISYAYHITCKVLRYLNHIFFSDTTLKDVTGEEPSSDSKQNRTRPPPVHPVKRNEDLGLNNTIYKMFIVQTGMSLPTPDLPLQYEVLFSK